MSSAIIAIYLTGVALSAIGFPVFFWHRMQNLYDVGWDRNDTMFCIFCTATGSLVWPVAWPINLYIMRKR